MNSKYAKMALPGLVMGLALGLSLPTASFAQDRDHGDHGWQGRGNSGGGDHADRRSDRGGWQGNRPAAPAPAPGGDRGAFVGARTQTGAAVANWGGPRGGGNTNVNVDVQAHAGAGGQPGYRGDWRGGDDHRGGSWQGDGDHRGNWQGGGDHRGGNWQGGNDHRGDNRGDDHHGDWRGGDGDHRGDWRGGDRGGGHFDWHGDSRFHDYSGVRMGFYFAPGHGYYHVPQQWYGHHWDRGEYLPRYFFSYRIYDPDYYDLPYPPYGCAWMFVGEDAVLVDLDTGQVIDVIYDVF